jgi:glycosyltransferase involved in cell wall biosynthesis
MKVVVYLDQVYLCQKKVYLDHLEKNADAVIAFTEHWKKVIVEQGLTLPTYVLEHGFDSTRYFPIPKDVARTYLGLDQSDFLVLNLNRNQPRKRWDICIKAWAEVVSRAPNSRMKLVVGTTIHGSWDLLEIYERELKKRSLSMEQGMKHLVVLDRPNMLSDFDINVLYNATDLGINTCDGEGFGLCNFEHAALGIPQVVPRIGGFLDFFDDSNATLVFPSIAYYVDASRDSLGGEALMSSYTDFAIAIEKYYNDPKLLKAHGDKCRETIPNKYNWEKLAEKLFDIVTKVLPDEKEVKKKKILEEIAKLQALLISDGM